MYRRPGSSSATTSPHCVPVWMESIVHTCLSKVTSGTYVHYLLTYTHALGPRKSEHPSILVPCPPSLASERPASLGGQITLLRLLIVSSFKSKQQAFILSSCAPRGGVRHSELCGERCTLASTSGRRHRTQCHASKKAPGQEENGGRRKICEEKKKYAIVIVIESRASTHHSLC